MCQMVLECMICIRLASQGGVGDIVWFLNKGKVNVSELFLYFKDVLIP